MGIQYDPNSLVLTGSLATNFVTKTGTATLTNDEGSVTCNGTFTVSLPASPETGQIHQIKNIGSGTVTIGRNGNNINGAAADLVLSNSGDAVILQFRSGSWWSMARGFTQLAVADGGTGAGTASGARTNLGLGTIATQNANAVTITGGTITSTFISASATLTISGGTISTDASTGNVFNVSMTANATLANPTNPANWQKVMWVFKQDGTGGRTLTFDTAFRFSDDLPSFTLSSAANATDYILAIYNATDSKWDILANNCGF